ncbi:MAG: MFS transporter [Elusimicrobiota bacterium]
MTARTRRRKRLPAAVSREVRLLCVCQAVLSFGLGLAFPFFAIYLHRERGLPMTWVGVWLSAGVLATALSQGWGGTLSDRWGRRRVMVLSLWARAATVLVLAAAIHGGWPLQAIVGVHLLSSFVSHFFEPSARGWVADHSKPTERHRAYGLLRTATCAGFAVGPALGGLIADRSYYLLFAASAVVCAVSAAVASLVLKDSPSGRPQGQSDKPGEAEEGADPSFLKLCFFYALLSIAMAQLVVPLSLYATKFMGLRDSQMGLLLSLNGVLIVLFQIPAVNLFAGIRLTVAIAFGSFLYAAGYAGVGWAGGLTGLIFAVAVVTGGEILVPSAVQALAANMSPPRLRGKYLGLLGLSRQIGSAIGPLAGCAGLEFAASRGLAGHWLAISAVAAIAGVGFMLLGGRLLPDEEGLVEEGLESEAADNLRLGA